MNKYELTDEMIPNKTLKDYKDNIINPILAKEKPGIKNITKNLFL